LQGYEFSRKSETGRSRRFV